ncbi:MAG: hypothetical protein JXQ83_10055 [Candidatus Glassbacteria bacterium]|nr:hypothetical protein [Candidatus Glassbacteria bacterium]
MNYPLATTREKIIVAAYSLFCFFLLSIYSPWNFMPSMIGAQYADMIGEPFNVLRSDLRVRAFNPLLATLVGINPYGWNYFLYFCLVLGSVYFSFYFLRENFALALLIPSTIITTWISHACNLWPGYPDILCLIPLGLALTTRSTPLSLFFLAAGILSHEAALFFLPFVLLYRHFYLAKIDIKSRPVIYFLVFLFLYFSIRIFLSLRGDFYSISVYFYCLLGKTSPRATEPGRVLGTGFKNLFSLKNLFFSWGLWLIFPIAGLYKLARGEKAKIFVWAAYAVGFLMIFVDPGDYERRFLYLAIPVIGSFRILFRQYSKPQALLVAIMAAAHFFIPGHFCRQGAVLAAERIEKTIVDIRQNGIPRRLEYFPFKRMHPYEEEKEMPAQPSH